MKNYMRIAIAGLAVALAPIVSNASEALIDFELPGMPADAKVGTFYQPAGVVFANEGNSALVSGLAAMDPAVNGNFAYQLTAPGGLGSSASFRIDVDSAVAQFDALQLLYFGPLRITLFTTDGKQDFREFGDAGAWLQNVQFSLDAAAFGLIDAIEITTSASSFSNKLLVDNIELSLLRSISPLPTPVPEPESFALAGLALLAAGVASRGRR